MTTNLGLDYALRQRGHSNETISEMSPEDRFDEWCAWNGFSDWGPRIRKVWELCQDDDPAE